MMTLTNQEHPSKGTPYMKYNLPSTVKPAKENNLQAFAASGRLGMTWERGEVDDLGTAFGHIWTL